MDEDELLRLEQAPLPETKAELLAHIARGRAALDESIAALTEDELADIRDGAGWSTADHLSHVAAWERMLVAHVAGGSEHEVAHVSRERFADLSLDELNEVLYHRLRGLTLAEALEEYAAAHEALVTCLRRLADDAFGQAYWRDEPDGRTVMEKVAGDTYRHYLEHWRWIGQMIRAAGA